MTPSDEKTLQDFLGQLVQARGVTKDLQADALIGRAVAEQPDAAYLLVQRALLVEQALGKAKARIAELERQTTKGGGGGMLGTVAATAAGVAAGSFLFHGIGNLLEHDGAEGGAGHLLADQAGIGAIDEPGAADDPLADSNHGDEPSGFFDGDGSDEGVFG